MAMPVQLARAKRRRPKYSEPRPCVELMQHVSIHELRHIIPRYDNEIVEPDIGFGLKYPLIERLRLSCSMLEITDRISQRVQLFKIKWVKTFFGKPRPTLECSCGRGAIRLFYKYGTWACRRCHKAVFACQKYDQIGRKRLAAAKLRLQLGGLPSIDEPLPFKPKWQHKQAYKNARKQLDRLETPIKSVPFRKPLSTSLFAYYVD